MCVLHKGGADICKILKKHIHAGRRISQPHSKNLKKREGNPTYRLLLFFGSHISLLLAAIHVCYYRESLMLQNQDLHHDPQG